MTKLLTTKSTLKITGTDARSMDLFVFYTVICVCLSLVLGVCIAGCSASHTIPAPAPGGGTRDVDAEWDNVKTAVEVGVGQAECSVVRWETTPDGLERRFEIKHVTGRHGVVAVRVRRGAIDNSGPEPLELKCSMGPIADAHLERAILGRIAHRLAELRGKPFAPIQE
jgi:hypothetical protein